jgi:hypothetical protein
VRVLTGGATGLVNQGQQIADQSNRYVNTQIKNTQQYANTQFQNAISGGGSVYNGVTSTYNTANTAYNQARINAQQTLTGTGKFVSDQVMSGGGTAFSALNQARVNTQQTALGTGKFVSDQIMSGGSALNQARINTQQTASTIGKIGGSGLSQLIQIKTNAQKTTFDIGNGIAGTGALILSQAKTGNTFNQAKIIAGAGALALTKATSGTPISRVSGNDYMRTVSNNAKSMISANSNQKPQANINDVFSGAANIYSNANSYASSLLGVGTARANNDLTDNPSLKIAQRPSGGPVSVSTKLQASATGADYMKSVSVNARSMASSGKSNVGKNNDIFSNIANAAGGMYGSVESVVRTLPFLQTGSATDDLSPNPSLTIDNGTVIQQKSANLSPFGITPQRNSLTQEPVKTSSLITGPLTYDSNVNLTSSSSPTFASAVMEGKTTQTINPNTGITPKQVDPKLAAAQKIFNELPESQKSKFGSITSDNNTLDAFLALTDTERKSEWMSPNYMTKKYEGMANKNRVVSWGNYKGDNISLLTPTPGFTSQQFKDNSGKVVTMDVQNYQYMPLEKPPRMFIPTAFSVTQTKPLTPSAGAQGVATTTVTPIIFNPRVNDALKRLITTNPRKPSTSTGIINPISSNIDSRDGTPINPNAPYFKANAPKVPIYRTTDYNTSSFYAIDRAVMGALSGILPTSTPTNKPPQITGYAPDGTPINSNAPYYNPNAPKVPIYPTSGTTLLKRKQPQNKTKKLYKVTKPVKRVIQTNHKKATIKQPKLLKPPKITQRPVKPIATRAKVNTKVITGGTIRGFGNQKPMISKQASKAVKIQKPKSKGIISYFY